jgi:hypothetical protein
MTKEFVTYEQAIALKELGFDEPCFGYYKHEELLIEGKYKNSDHGFSISAPTYSQAFRWFREKHQIEAIVSCIYSKTLDISYEERRYHCYIVRDGITTKGIKFKTYEEAESACLDKLIEITKTNE